MTKANDAMIVSLDDDKDELKAGIRALLSMDRQALKSYARSILMAQQQNTDSSQTTSTSSDLKSDENEIKVIENQLMDLVEAIHEAGELLFDLPLPLIVTKIFPYLPTRVDWNNFANVNRKLRTFTKSCPASTFSPPWPVINRPSPYASLDHLQLGYQYIMSPDGQFLAFTEVPPGMMSSGILVFSRKYGRYAALVSVGPFPFSKIHFKQQRQCEVMINKKVEGGSMAETATTIANVNGSDDTRETHVQAMDSGGNYVEWKLFQSPTDPGFSFQKVPKVNQWCHSEFGGNEGSLPVRRSKFSNDGKYLLHFVGHNEIVMQHVEKAGKVVLRYRDSKIKQLYDFCLSPNNKWLALASWSGNGCRAILQVCEIEGNPDGTLQVGRALYYEDSSGSCAGVPLAFSPNSTKLASAMPGDVGRIAIWDTTKLVSSPMTDFVPLLKKIRNVLPINETTFEGVFVVAGIAFSANGNHLIVNGFLPQPISANVARKSIMETWNIESNTLVSSTPTTSSVLEAVSHCMPVMGDRTFVLLEEREEKQQDGGNRGERENNIKIKKTVKVHEVDGMGRIVSFGSTSQTTDDDQDSAGGDQTNPAAASNSSSCAKCSKLETEDAKLRKCSRCKKTAYCSRECQKDDWKAHKKTCKAVDEEN